MNDPQEMALLEFYLHLVYMLIKLQKLKCQSCVRKDEEERISFDFTYCVQAEKRIIQAKLGMALNEIEELKKCIKDPAKKYEREKERA